MRLKALAGVVNARKRELVFSFRMLCENVYQVIQVQANEVLTKRIRSIKCNLMRQDGGVSGGVAGLCQDGPDGVGELDDVEVAGVGVVLDLDTLDGGGVGQLDGGCQWCGDWSLP